MVTQTSGYSGRLKEPPLDVMLYDGDDLSRQTTAYVEHSVISACTMGKWKSGTSLADGYSSSMSVINMLRKKWDKMRFFLPQ